jgi:carboxyl-terminal processing protease
LKRNRKKEEGNRSMRQLRIRFMLTFLAGVITAGLVSALTVGVRASGASRYDDLSLFTHVLNLVRSNYVEPVDDTDLIRGAVRGMLRDLDPHSSFLDVDAFQEMQVDTKGEFHGLGIEISKQADGFIQVIAPIEGTPADRAGIEARDRIVKICPTEVPEDWEEDCRSTKSMTLFEAVSLMRGRRGTEITIEIFRKGFDKPQPFKVVRDVVKVVSVSGRLLEPGYGYVRIRSFQERTTEELHRALGEIAAESNTESGAEEGAPLTGLVIDLRDNPGGLLDQAVQASDTWLSEGLILVTKGRHDEQRQEYRAHGSGTEPDYPITVLVNGGSASASEILAGALQDQQRALIVGQKTFGKGSVQTVFPLEGDHGLRLTTALYYTPAGRSIQEVGITPDIIVKPAPQLVAAEHRARMSEADLEGHFTQSEASPALKTSDEDADEWFAEDDSSDVQLMRAIEVLKSWNYFDHLRGDQSPDPLQARAPETAP